MLARNACTRRSQCAKTWRPRCPTSTQREAAIARRCRCDRAPGARRAPPHTSMALFSLALMCPARSRRRAPSQRRLALPACLCHHHASTFLRVYGAAGKLRSGQRLQRGVLQCVPRGAHVRVGDGGGTADVRQRGAPLWAPSCENDGAVESVGGAGAPRGASCRHCRAVPRVPSDVDWSSSVTRRCTSGGESARGGSQLVATPWWARTSRLGPQPAVHGAVYGPIGTRASLRTRRSMYTIVCVAYEAYV